MADMTYIGARYVPKLEGTWDINLDYDYLAVVDYEGSSYISRRPVPAGTQLSNRVYWMTLAERGIKGQDADQAAVDRAVAAAEQAVTDAQAATAAAGQASTAAQAAQTAADAATQTAQTATQTAGNAAQVATAADAKASQAVSDVAGAITAADTATAAANNATRAAQDASSAATSATAAAQQATTTAQSALSTAQQAEQTASGLAGDIRAAQEGVTGLNSSSTETLPASGWSAEGDFYKLSLSIPLTRVKSQNNVIDLYVNAAASPAITAAAVEDYQKIVGVSFSDSSTARAFIFYASAAPSADIVVRISGITGA